MIEGALGRWIARPVDLDRNILEAVSSRLDKSWTVLASHQSLEGDRCVDVFSRPDGSFGFEEFRKDPEDMGAWTPVAYFSGRQLWTEEEATDVARHAVPWLARLFDASS